MNLKDAKIGVVGFGNMAQAVILGAIASKDILAKNVYVLAHKSSKDRLYQKKHKVKIAATAKELCQKVDILFLAVKPQQLKQVLPEFKPHFKNQLVITVIAGITSPFYKKQLGAKVKLIRSMPNTPALIGLGATGLFATKNCKSSEVKTSQKLFNAVGTTVLLKSESKIDVVAALSGSGPAFLYQYSQAMISTGMKLGLTSKVSKALLVQTLKGAAALMEQSNATPDALTKKVASKGGSTLAGLKVLRDNRFNAIIDLCLKASVKRAKELSQLFGK